MEFHLEPHSAGTGKSNVLCRKRTDDDGHSITGTGSASQQTFPIRSIDDTNRLIRRVTQAGDTGGRFGALADEPPAPVDVRQALRLIPVQHCLEQGTPPEPGDVQ
jgi:hypothetical protein